MADIVVAGVLVATTEAAAKVIVEAMKKFRVVLVMGVARVAA
jgi:hypothetical protein